MKSMNVKSAREHLLDKYNLSMMSKSETAINELKCDALSETPSLCLNPFVKSSAPYSRKRSMCFTQQMNNQKLKNQNIKSSSQYVNHNIKKCKLLKCIRDTDPNVNSQSTLLELTADVRSLEMDMVMQPKINFDAENKSKTLLSFNEKTEPQLQINNDMNNSGKKTYMLSTFNNNRTFEDSTTFEKVELVLPPHSKLTNIKLNSYSNKESKYSNTNLCINDGMKQVAKSEFNHENVNKSILESEEIVNKTSNEKVFEMVLCDPNTMNVETFIMSNRNYVLEMEYEFL